MEVFGNMKVVDNGVELSDALVIVIHNDSLYPFKSSIEAIDKYCELKEKENEIDLIQLFYRNGIVSRLKG